MELCGTRSFDAPDNFIREAGYPPGVFAVSTVSMPDRPRLLAFDVKSNGVAICTRIGQQLFDLPNTTNGKFARFRCPGDWTSREVVFLDATEFEPKYAQELEWSALAGPSPLPMPGGSRDDSMTTGRRSPGLMMGNGWSAPSGYKHTRQ